MSAEIEIRPTTYAEWNALEEERDQLRAELDRLRSAPVSVEVPDTPGYEWRSILDRMPMDTWLICSNQDARLFWAKQAPRSGQWTFGGVGFRDPTHWLAPRLSLSPQPSAPVAVEVPWEKLEQLVKRFIEIAETFGQIKELAKIDEHHLQNAAFLRAQPTNETRG